MTPDALFIGGILVLALIGAGSILLIQWRQERLPPASDAQIYSAWLKSWNELQAVIDPKVAAQIRRAAHQAAILAKLPRCPKPELN